MFNKIWRYILDKVWKSDPWRETSAPRLKPAIQIQPSLPPPPPPVIPAVTPIVIHADKAPWTADLDLTTVAASAVPSIIEPKVELLTDTAPTPVEIVPPVKKRRKPPTKLKSGKVKKSG